MHPVLHQVGDVRIAAQKPQKFVDNPLQKDLFGRQQRETLFEVEAHLVAKDTLRAGAGTVASHDALRFDATEQIEVLLHINPILSR